MSTTTTKRASSSSSNDIDIGRWRRVADVRQLAALCMFCGICNIFHPIGGVVGAIGPDGTTPSSGTPLAGLFGGLILCTIGVLSIFIGYNQLIHGWGHKYVTGGVLLFTQSVYVAYVSDVAGIGQAARTGAAFIPAILDPSPAAVRFVGACGIVGVIAYGFTFAGTTAFFQFALYSYQAGKPHHRNGPYYAGRMGFYCGMLALAGITQFVLNVFLAVEFGPSRLAGTVGVAMFVINYPGIGIFLGIFQMVNGVWGIFRSRGLLVFGKGDMSYPIAMFVLWFSQLVLQVIAQVGIGGPTPAAAAIFALAVGQNLMPAFLDFKARTVPDDLQPSYFGDEVEGEEGAKHNQTLQEQSSDEEGNGRVDPEAGAGSYNN